MRKYNVDKEEVALQDLMDFYSGITNDSSVFNSIENNEDYIDMFIGLSIIQSDTRFNGIEGFLDFVKRRKIVGKRKLELKCAELNKTNSKDIIPPKDS